MVLRSLLSNGQGSWIRLHDDPFVIMQRGLRSLGETDKAALSVRLDVQEDDAAYQITADLPGLTENEIEVVFEEGVLSLRGEKKILRDESKGTWHITERSSGGFSRQVTLPNAVDAEKIEARFNKGVLNLTLPKLAPEAPKAKKIEVKSVN